jgi:hypothetical protein
MLAYPRIFFLFAFLVLWLAAQGGALLRRRRPLKEDEREDFNVIEAATLTLLGLIIGFSFSMATTRYDLRKNYEEAEANAIGTEYYRATLLPAEDAAKVQAQLVTYIQLRLRFYRTREHHELPQINADTGRLQSEMWTAVQVPAMAHPSPVIALAVAGMNDVLNSQGYTQAAWWNRIPKAAWILMITIAVCCNLLVGYGARSAGPKSGLLIVLPLVIATAFLLISDIDSPRSGFIHVAPQNLISLSQSLAN